MGKLKKAQKILEGFYEKNKKSFKEGARYAESFSKAAEEHFGLPNDKRKKKPFYEEDDFL